MEGSFESVVASCVRTGLITEEEKSSCETERRVGKVSHTHEKQPARSGAPPAPPPTRPRAARGRRAHRARRACGLRGPRPQPCRSVRGDALCPVRQLVPSPMTQLHSPLTHHLERLSPSSRIRPRRKRATVSRHLGVPLVRVQPELGEVGKVAALRRVLHEVCTYQLRQQKRKLTSGAAAAALPCVVKTLHNPVGEVGAVHRLALAW